ncbi:MAG: xanthine dehydrogenase accessory protein XdhC [Rhizobiales bacterium]|nr:xanthine dehydrogenase accessory protein XdhC [Hyphomicrobiales bacterium]
MQIWFGIAKAVKTHGKCALVTQLSVDGSAPREAGARMVVMPDGTFTGTIGGGALEWRALALAQAALRRMDCAPQITRHALGPELGQCCGGVSRLMVEVFTADRSEEIDALAGAEANGVFTTRGQVTNDGVSRQILDEREDAGIDWDGGSQITETFGEVRRPVYLFGAGHVGRAMILALAPLPFEVIWIDPRKGEFPGAVPANVTMVSCADPAAQLTAAPDGSFIVILTHSHALDLDLVHSALKAERFGYVGVIGSATKRARFLSRMRKAGLASEVIDRMVCPIGAGGPSSKHPAIIAASVAAELLIHDELVKNSQKPMQSAPQVVRLRNVR